MLESLPTVQWSLFKKYFHFDHLFYPFFIPWVLNNHVVYLDMLYKDPSADTATSSTTTANVPTQPRFYVAQHRFPHTHLLYLLSTNQHLSCSSFVLANNAHYSLAVLSLCCQKESLWYEGDASAPESTCLKYNERECEERSLSRSPSLCDQRSLLFSYRLTCFHQSMIILLLVLSFINYSFSYFMLLSNTGKYNTTRAIIFLLNIYW